MSVDRFATLFEHPEWLPATVAFVTLSTLALVLARLVAGRRRRTLLGPGARGRGRGGLRDAALLVALGAIGLALLGPRVGERSVQVHSSGVDVVFLIDVSRSMDARDVPPSRIERAKRGAEELLARLEPGDRAALAVFASRGVLLTPLTPDRGALLELLSAVDTQLLHPPASKLGDGLRAALGAFAVASDRPRVVFVLSDGEDPERRRHAGAAAAARAGVRVLAAALGSDVGAEVPDHGVPLRDGAGRIVHSRREVGRLARLAEETGGEVFPGDAWGGFDFERAAASIRRDASSASGASVSRRVRAVRVFPLAAAAFVLLLAEALPRTLTPRRRRRGVALATPALAALLLGAAPEAPTDVAAIETRLRATPGDAVLLVRLGLARLERDANEAAARAFAAAAVIAAEPRVAAVAYYDLGVTALAQGDLETARDAFFDALALAPRDREARFNLEWTLRGLAARPPPSPPGSAARGVETVPPGAADSAPTTPTPPPGARGFAERPGKATPPSEAERARWLARVEDDPTRSIRSAARSNAGSRRRHGPAW